MGHGAVEIINTFAVAIKYGVTASELGNIVYAYPTMTNDIKFLV
jgi:glutathione reductase (NADPH)